MESAKPRPTRAEIVGRLLLAHGLSLPLFIGWAAAAIPPLIHVHSDELLRIGEMEAVGQFMVRKMVTPGGVGLVLQHLAVVPWLIAREPARAKRMFVITTATLYGVAAVIGAIGWGWLFLRAGE